MTSQHERSLMSIISRLVKALQRLDGGLHSDFVKDSGDTHLLENGIVKIDDVDHFDNFVLARKH